jgi:hypothetical protein
MPKVDDVAWMSQRHGFLVRQDDDQPIASFEFTSEAAAQAAQKQMQEILATCVEAMEASKCKDVIPCQKSVVRRRECKARNPQPSEMAANCSARRRSADRPLHIIGLP